MATQGEVDRLRRIVDEADKDFYSDADLNEILDRNPTLNAATLEIWKEKAARYSSLVNTTESGTNRSMGDLFNNAMRMVNHYEQAVRDEAAVTPAPVRAQTRTIERV